MGNIETTMKFSRLKSVSSIEDNYLEGAASSRSIKKLFLKISQYSQEKNCVRVSF